MKKVVTSHRHERENRDIEDFTIDNTINEATSRGKSHAAIRPSNSRSIMTTDTHT